MTATAPRAGPGRQLPPEPGGDGWVPQIRIFDMVAYGDRDGALAAGEGRHIEWSTGEYLRVNRVLKYEGMEAFHVYVQAMHHEMGPDGRPMLVIDDFSARWLQEHSELGKNQAYEAQRRLKAVGLFTAVVSRPGEGARGKQRAVLNPRLVLIPGGAKDAPAGLARRSSVPGSRKAGTREPGAEFPGFHDPGTREPGAISRVPGNWEPGNSDGPQAPETAALPVSGSDLSTGRTSSGSNRVIENLLSTDIATGELHRSLLPLLRRDPEHVAERLLTVFNQAWIADRAASLVTPLRLTPLATERGAALTDYLLGVLLGDVDPTIEFVRLGVQGTPPKSLTVEQLRERLVIGIVVGLGVKDGIKQWGGWMRTALRVSWVPQPNKVLNLFAAELVYLEEGRQRQLDRLAAAELAPTHADSAEHPDAGVPAAVGVQLTTELIEQHFEAARSEMTKLPASWRSGEDPATKARLVRAYLDLHPELADSA